MLFIEQPFTELIDEVCLTRLLTLTQAILEENDTWNPKELSLLVGLNTSIFKQFWMKFKMQEAVNVNTIEITGALIKHLDCLFLQLSKTDWEYQEAMIVLIKVEIKKKK